MDREGFRNRLKQYKKAREENPGLKYWEWKAIPKYGDGTDLIGKKEIQWFKDWYNKRVEYAIANNRPDIIKQLESLQYNFYPELYKYSLGVDWDNSIYTGTLDPRINDTKISINDQAIKDYEKKHGVKIGGYLHPSEGIVLPSNYNSNDLLHELAHTFNQTGSVTNAVNSAISDENGFVTIPEGLQNPEYWISPWEVHSRLMLFREENNIDPTKVYNEEDIKQLRKSAKDKILFEIFDDSQMMHLLNDVADNATTSTDDRLFLKNGGIVPMYGGGTGNVEKQDNTRVASIEKEQVFIPATGELKRKQELLNKLSRNGQIKSGAIDIVSPEYDLLTGVRAITTLPTKAEKLGRKIFNSNFISDDEITDLINSKRISDLTTFTKKIKNDSDWYVHTDLGKSNSVFAGNGKGAYIQDRHLHPGEALIFDQKPYAWWNRGKRYARLGENEDGYLAIIIKGSNAKDLLQVNKSQNPIGQWNGKSGFVLQSEYVTQQPVNLTPDIEHYIYDGLTKTYGNVKHYKDGGEVTGPPTYEDWYENITKPTINTFDDVHLKVGMEEAATDLHNIAMTLPGYADRWNEYQKSRPKEAPSIDQFVDDLWLNENPNKVGYRNGKYYPHNSPEGGSKTIGPGFKLGSGSHRITDTQAKRGLTKWQLDKEAERIGLDHLAAVDSFINYGQNTNPADTVSPLIKMGLMDLRHLVGPLNTWHELRDAVLSGDLDKIKKESTVTWSDNGKTKVDKRRKKIRDEKYFYYE